MSLFSSLVFVLLCLYNLSFLEALNGSFNVEIIHRDSPKSPFYSSKETQFQRVANAVHRSIYNVNRFNKPSISKNSAQAIVTPDHGEYLMSYYIGTPPFQIFGIVDTGSDIIWLQCQPCKSCYKQSTPIFDSSKSKSYKPLPCSSNKCTSLFSYCSKEKNCSYFIKYQDGSHSDGDLSMETLTLGSSVQIPSIVIGCGRSSSITYEGANSGVVGLGNGPVSLINQLGSSIGWKFSYCLVPIFSQSNSSSKLNFGDVAVVSGQGTVSTPIVIKGRQVFYYLILEALSVGNTRIEVGSSRSGGTGNIVIDSGTTVTFLPNVVYSKLESAVAEEVKLTRDNDPFGVFNLCYKCTFDKLVVPVIIAHFSGANVNLNALNTFIQVDNDVVCFAFLPTNGDAIFGNLAQQNLLVGYDLQKKTVSFKITDCTKQ